MLGVLTLNLILLNPVLMSLIMIFLYLLKLGLVRTYGTVKYWALMFLMFIEMIGVAEEEEEF